MSVLPDNWSIVRIKPPDTAEVIYRVAAGWGGSYLGGRSWKLSSTIDSFTEDMDYVDFHNSSGSTYTGRFGCQELDWYTSSIMTHYQKLAREAGGEFDIITFDQFKKERNG